jgi:hypothetical protein
MDGTKAESIKPELDRDKHNLELPRALWYLLLVESKASNVFDWIRLTKSIPGFRALILDYVVVVGSCIIETGRRVGYGT